MAVSRQEGERGTRNRKTEGRTDESKRTRSGRRITGTADEDGREERAMVWTVRATDRERNGEENDAGRMTDSPRSCSVVACCWSIGGEVVAMWCRWHHTEADMVAALPSLCLLVRRWRGGERLAMVWTVEASDGTEERRGTGEDVGGILRPGFLSFCFVCSFALPYHHHLKEEDEDEDKAGRMEDRIGSAMVPFLPGRSIPSLFPSLFAFVFSLYIIMYI